MYTLVVKYQTKPGQREAFLQAVQEAGVDACSRAEAGNFCYDFYRAVGDENQALLLEHWADEAAQKRHTETAHFQRMTALKQQYVLETVIERYGA